MEEHAQAINALLALMADAHCSFMCSFGSSAVASPNNRRHQRSRITIVARSSTSSAPVITIATVLMTGSSKPVSRKRRSIAKMISTKKLGYAASVGSMLLLVLTAPSRLSVSVASVMRGCRHRHTNSLVGVDAPW